MQKTRQLDVPGLLVLIAVLVQLFQVFEAWARVKLPFGDLHAKLQLLQLQHECVCLLAGQARELP